MSVYEADPLANLRAAMHRRLDSPSFAAVLTNCSESREQLWSAARSAAANAQVCKRVSSIDSQCYSLMKRTVFPLVHVVQRLYQ